MTTRLSDGSVVPSFLAQFVRSSAHLKDEGSHSNLALRLGEVTKKYPDTKGHQTVMTYDVEVVHADHKRAQTSVIYAACTVVNLFGGADYTRWTLRPRSGPVDTSTGFGDGSKVLILCINGRTTQAWIVGGIMDAATPSDDPDPELKYWTQVFNGVQIDINNDGEYSVTSFGPTDQTGQQITQQDESAIVPSVTLNKNNNILLNSEGVLTGEATDNTVLGSTYIEAEKSALEDFVSNMQQVAADLAQAGAGLMVVAPPAGTALTKASADLLTALEPISNFTNNAEDYLSKKNKSD